MGSATDRAIRFSLEGDWSMSGITDQFQVLRHCAAQLAESGTGAASPELDLTGITELDASGCQLLTAFVTYLRHQGITPHCNGMTEAVTRRLRQLGFDHGVHSLQNFSREQTCPTC